MKQIENRNQFIGCRVSPTEMNDIQERAALVGVSLSEYIRHQAQERPVVKIYQPAELIQQLLAIGRNINQLTKLSNASKKIDHDTIMKVQQEWNLIRDLVIEFIGSAEKVTKDAEHWSEAT